MSNLPLSLELQNVELEKNLNTLRLLHFTKAQKRRILRKVGRAVIKDAKKNIREQKDIHGKAFAKRKGRARRKLLRNMAKPLSEKVLNDRVRVDYFKNRGAGRVAAEQQYGLPQTYTAAKLKEQRKESEPSNHYQLPATRQQAKRLIESGFKIRRKGGKGKKRPSVKWVTENLTQGQFGAIYRELTGEKTKKSWKITPPKREFLGMPEREAQQLLTDEIIKTMGS